MSKQMQSHICRVKEGKLGKWRAWCQRINQEYNDWGVKTLKDEGVAFELFLLFEIGGMHYTCGIMLANEDSGIKPSKIDDELNKKHYAMMEECLEVLGQGEALYILRADY